MSKRMTWGVGCVAWLCTLVLAALVTGGCASRPHARQSSLADEARGALKQLQVEDQAAASMAKQAKAILVFPEIIKGGFVIGGFHGEGVMFRDGDIDGYYTSAGGSYGLQAGLQQFAYALFFMNEEDLAYLNQSDGWEIGVGPTVTVMDRGLATSLTTTTSRKGVYCFFFDQKGLMAGTGIQGSKITRLDP